MLAPLEAPMRVVIWSTLLALCACSGDGGKDGNTDGDTDATDRFGEFINTTVAATGDLACFTPGDDWASTTWLTQTIDPANQGTYPINARVEDFEEDTPVSSATVAVWTDDVVDGQPDTTATSDNNGNVTFDGPSCSSTAYRVTTDGGPTATKTTFKAHQIYPAPTGNTIEDATFVSVSDVTYQLIPGILGVSVDPDKAIIAGTAYDCGRDAAQNDDDNKITGAQVIVYDEDGNIPDTLQVNYFTENFPDRDQEQTSADGLWVASNVPPGNLRVELWASVGGELTLLGATELVSEADSINIGNIYAGYGDGVKYPATCESGATTTPTPTETGDTGTM
jgi:hypothetical protein